MKEWPPRHVVLHCNVFDFTEVYYYMTSCISFVFFSFWFFNNALAYYKRLFLLLSQKAIKGAQRDGCSL